MILQPTGLHHVEHVMGMAVSFDVRDGAVREADSPVLDLAGALHAATEWLHAVDATWSTYRDDSQITRFARGEIRAEDLSEEMHEVLDMCAELSWDSDGAFDIAIPAPNGTQLEPSGFVKGWSLERAAELLASFGLKNFCINGGGDIVVRGRPSPNSPWILGVRHPTLDQKTALILHGEDRFAVATSATYERGQHIIDPRTKAPADEVTSVTVVGPDLTWADAYATTIFVMGTEGLLWLHERHPQYAACVFTHDGTVMSTPTFRDFRA